MATKTGRSGWKSHMFLHEGSCTFLKCVCECVCCTVRPVCVPLRVVGQCVRNQAVEPGLPVRVSKLK